MADTPAPAAPAPAPRPTFLTAEQRVERWFQYHAPTPAEVEKINRMRNAARCYAETLVAELPAGPDLTVLLRGLHALSMQANAALVTRDGR